MRHPLPGNVRELENIIEYCFVLCHNGQIDLPHLPNDLQPAGASQSGVRDSSLRDPLEESEAETIRSALSRNQGNRAATADDLRISRTTLWRKMKRHGIREDEFPSGHMTAP